ncbi:ATP-binding protein [Rhizobium sp. SEMIA 4085]|uniref:ATPase domain-containing protein n=1 Tax=Rhizobium gallicum bv. gallicum R602sp TaxID=1041138 RepID=A0A0B4XC13_9HYPH|nr:MULTISPECIES: ATP-binding protein [Rhizobium]AJD44052.1 ATPase domain-containing protein [Rhizobium gallicum bv. gallicum R602sp]NNH31266.1 ATP-binding protein [Rhizobium sp. SEMIA 4085]
MIARWKTAELVELLNNNPAVALLGPRQVGKTTLALEIGEQRPSIYLDLESDSDRAKLAEPELYLAGHEDKLVVLDEVHRLPDLFQNLRGLIDRGRRKGLRSGRFLLLGSASMDLLKQSGESLAGRIAYLELAPIDGLEVEAGELNKLWVRGGFPDSLLAANDTVSQRWRIDFIRTYLERDIPLLGPRIPAETLRRFWTMLAHHQSGLLNAAEFARALGVDGKTVASYLDLMVDLLLVRRLEPWHSNAGKRLVKSPRVYVRDSGLLHSLLGLTTLDDVLGHPVAGASWEGFVIETLHAVMPEGAQANFYRTSAGAEIDLVVTLPRDRRWAIEIKRSLTPKVERGFHHACLDLEPDRRIVVYPGSEAYPLGNDIEVLPLRQLGEQLAGGRE